MSYFRTLDLPVITLTPYRYRGMQINDPYELRCTRQELNIQAY